MKIMLFLMMLIITSIAEDVHKWSHDYKSGLQEAKKEHKLLYVFITSDSCRWCRKFESTTLQDKSVLKRLHKEFVTVHLSRDRHEIPKIFQTAPIPRHYFLDAQGKILYDSLGYRGVDCFDAFMDNAEKKYQVSE